MTGYADSEGMLLNLDQMALEKVGFSLKNLQPNQIIPVNLGIAKDSKKSKVIAEMLRNLYPGKLGQSYDVRFNLSHEGIEILIYFEFSL